LAQTAAISRGLVLAAAVANAALGSAFVVALIHFFSALGTSGAQPELARWGAVLGATGLGVAAVSLVAVVALGGQAWRAEEARRSNERLVRQLQNAVAHSDRLAAIGTMTASVVHDLRGLLCGLSMGIELLSELEDAPAQDRKRLTENLEASVQRLSVQVDRLTRFARKDTDGGTVAARQAVLDAHRLIGVGLSRRVTLELELGAGEVPMNDVLMVQVMMNLMLNALDFAPNARVRLCAEGEAAVISVDDDGCGVPPALRDQVFDAFVTTRKAGKGTGLGLFQCRQAVEEAGGSIAVSDSDLGGARFIVRLPWACGPALALAG